RPRLGTAGATEPGARFGLGGKRRTRDRALVPGALSTTGSPTGGPAGAWQDGPVTRRIAYQGEPGSNSDIVCRQYYPDWGPLACASFEDVFAAVAGGQAQL